MEEQEFVMLSVGVDIIEIARVEAAIARWGDRFLQRVYTPPELAYARGRVSELAARFAAKEAISKALGLGIWWRGGITWHEAEVLPDPYGKPEVYLHGRAAIRARDLDLLEWAISLSHADEFAVAFVVAM
jgi:holo-[acyl-carrier protein] synthase